IVVIIAAFLARSVKSARLAIAVIVSMLAIYTTVYVTTAWVPSELIAVTADRLMTHVIAPSLFLLALAIRETGTSAARRRRASRRGRQRSVAH
ncbi:MAG: hypothetical protein QOE82_926, partial [Thermoanaerobaculia bacterium]|nr:hypothetical protein [Thermoanaerobaculia bacterium]